MQTLNSLQNLTDICWIGSLKEGDGQEICLVKSFLVDVTPKFAAIRLNSKGICAIFINGQFIESSLGRYHNRITFVECTSALKRGENTVELRYVGHYYQPSEIKASTRRGGLFCAVAAQIELHQKHGIKYIATDESWQLNLMIPLFRRTETHLLCSLVLLIKSVPTWC